MATGGHVRRDRDRRVDARWSVLFLMCFAMLIVSLDSTSSSWRCPTSAAHWATRCTPCSWSCPPTPLPPAGSCSSVAGRPTFLAGAGCWPPGWSSMPSPRWPAAWPRPGDPARCPGGAGPGRGAGVPGDAGRDHDLLRGRGRTATVRWECGVQQGRPGWWWACWPAACSPATSGGPRCSSSTCRWPSPRWRSRSSSSRATRHATGPAASIWRALWPPCRR